MTVSVEQDDVIKIMIHRILVTKLLITSVALIISVFKHDNVLNLMLLPPSYRELGCGIAGGIVDAKDFKSRIVPDFAWQAVQNRSNVRLGLIGNYKNQSLRFVWSFGAVFQVSSI